MAFEGLTDKLQNAFKKLSGKGKLSEADVKAAMREVRMALLEADVNFTVVKDFIKKVTERAVGQEILGSLTPGQQVVKIVNDELTQLMGGTNAKLTYSPQPPTIYMPVSYTHLANEVLNPPQDVVERCEFFRDMSDYMDLYETIWMEVKMAR